MIKITTCLLSFLISVYAFPQTHSLPSKVYSWDSSSSVSNANGDTRNIFKGSGTILSMHAMNAITLLKGKSVIYNSDSSNERFFIIKNGPVTVTLNDHAAVLDRGSVVSVLPGDEGSIENKGATAVQFYEMTYRAVEQPRPERGQKAGGSFILDWNRVAFKPHDKGGVRQFFD